MHSAVVIIIYGLEGKESSGSAGTARIQEVGSDEVSDRDLWKLVGQGSGLMKKLFTFVAVPSPGGKQVSSRASIFLVEHLLPSSREHPLQPILHCLMGGGVPLGTEHAKSAPGLAPQRQPSPSEGGHWGAVLQPPPPSGGYSSRGPQQDRVS